MRKTFAKLGSATLCGSLLIQMIAGCASSGDKTKAEKSKVVSDASAISYRMVAKPGPGVSKMYYYAYLFPSIRMSKKGTPIEKMTPVKGEGGAIKRWRTSSARSSEMSRWAEKTFRGEGYDLISFPQLLERTQPYSVLVVSTFYTDSAPIKEPEEGGPDRSVTVQVKGALFGLDLDPAKSLPVGSVLCTGFYHSDKHDVNQVAGKLLVEASRNLGEQFESFGKL